MTFSVPLEPPPKESLYISAHNQAILVKYIQFNSKAEYDTKRRRSSTKKGDVGIRVDKHGGKGVKQSARGTETTSKQKDGALGVNWGVT